MDKDDKLYADREKKNIGPHVTEWQKKLDSVQIEAEKDHEGKVEKTMEALSERGMESKVSKNKSASVIRYKGAVYKLAEQPGMYVPNEGPPTVKSPPQELQKPDLDNTVTWKQNFDKTMDLIDSEPTPDHEETLDLLKKAFAAPKMIRHEGALYRLANEPAAQQAVDLSPAWDEVMSLVTKQARALVERLKSMGFEPKKNGGWEKVVLEAAVTMTKFMMREATPPKSQG